MGQTGSNFTGSVTAWSEITMKVLLQRMDVLGFGAEAEHLRSSPAKRPFARFPIKGMTFTTWRCLSICMAALSTWALAGNSAGGMMDGTRNPGVSLRNGFPGTGGHNFKGSRRL